MSNHQIIYHRQNREQEVHLKNYHQPPFPTSEETSGSRDQPKYDNPESEHEPNGKPGRPPNTQPSHNILKKDKPKETPKAKAAARVTYDTETIHNDDPEFWKEQNLGLIKDQLGKRNFKKEKRKP